MLDAAERLRIAGARAFAFVTVLPFDRARLGADAGAADQAHLRESIRRYNEVVGGMFHGWCRAGGHFCVTVDTCACPLSPWLPLTGRRLARGPHHGRPRGVRVQGGADVLRAVHAALQRAPRFSAPSVALTPRLRRRRRTRTSTPRVRAPCASVRPLPPPRSLACLTLRPDLWRDQVHPSYGFHELWATLFRETVERALREELRLQ